MPWQGWGQAECCVHTEQGAAGSHLPSSVPVGSPRPGGAVGLEGSAWGGRAEAADPWVNRALDDGEMKDT